MHTIQDFWIPRLRGVIHPPAVPTLPGWSIEPSSNQSFVEADLRLREGFGNLAATVWFVAAPGAVGKSTLAREISARTGAIYLDLAKADTVAGNSLTGGLVKNQLLGEWQENKTAILIDALDEARLRVTQKSFEDFLKDVEELARRRAFPTVIFGRVGIVEDAWLSLADSGLDCPVFDIDFFDAPRARQFIIATLDRLARKSGNEALAISFRAHKSVYEKAAASFVTGLEKVAAYDGARFAGYAPVLEAVATVLSGITNPANLNDVVQEALQGQILQHLADRILAREATKLREQLPATIPDAIKQKLYGPEEQLTRLTATIYHVNVPAPNIGLQPQHVEAYDAAVRAFMPQHPFLDGTGRQASGSVFGAAINAHALFSAVPEMVRTGEVHAGNGPYTPNPFLIDFYLASARLKAGDDPIVPPEHVAALYESVRARASAKEIVRLSVEGDEDSDAADVEIQVNDAGAQHFDRRILLRTSQAGVLRFGRQVNGVMVEAPQLDVTIGSGAPVEVVAPVSLNVARLSFDCPELVILRGDAAGNGEDASVVLEAHQLLESKIVGTPIVRKGAEFAVSWPGASSYPWAQFAASGTQSLGKDVDEALLGLRRLVLAFRSHSKGRLARFRGKIEHARMTKGKLGVAIRDRLLKDNILSIEGEMYFLDPKALGRIVGATYQDLNLKRFNDQVRRYVASIAA